MNTNYSPAADMNAIRAEYGASFDSRYPNSAVMACESLMEHGAVRLTGHGKMAQRRADEILGEWPSVRVERVTVLGERFLQLSVY